MGKKRNKSEIKTEAYRHSGEKRTNIPSAKIAAEGVIPKIKKARYFYSPHLSPELRFDPTGQTDRVLRIFEAAREYVAGPMKGKIEAVIQNNQPWLEWAGKKEEYDRGFFNIDPVALHIHERVSTQAIVGVAMREDAQRDLFADPQLPYQKEVQFYQHDIDWANRLILGDGLQVMSSLARRENLAGKVQMIYIDPPYGIRFASNFQPEIGKKDVKEKTEDMTREPEMVRAYRDTWSLGIHSYLAYLRDRRIVARELLSNTGSIFMQIGEENRHRVRLLLGEVFEERNFISEITYKTSIGLGGSFLDAVSNYVIWFAKEKQRAEDKYHQIYNMLAIGQVGATRYTKAKSRESGEIRHLTEDEQEDPNRIGKEWEPFTDQGLTSRSGGATTLFSVPFQGRKYIPTAGGWRTNEMGMQRVLRAERIIPAGNTVRFRKCFDDFGALALTNFWEDVGGGIQSRGDPKVYVVQTATKIIERCMLMTTDPGDIVLDPTCGSGTTAYVAEQRGRRWITVDTSRVSIAIARQRLLTARFDYYCLQNEDLGIAGGFRYKMIPHVTLKSIAQNQNLDSIFSKHVSILDASLASCNKALALVSDSIRDKCKQKLQQKINRDGRRAIPDADRMRWEFPKKGVAWEHWEVPFDTDSDWPKQLQDSVVAYRKAWRVKMDEVNSCISTNAEQEELVDQPEIERGIVRVSGPFTVEGVRPEELSLSDEEDAPSDIRDDVQNLRAYLSRMVDLIRKDGVTFTGNNFRKFERVTALYEERTGSPVHASGIWQGSSASELDSVAIAFGPQYGPVTAQQVEEFIRASKRFDELVIAGFSFDGEAAVAIQEASHPKLKIHMAHIRPDVSPGMDGLLKDTPNSQLFTVFGQPEVKVKRHGQEEYQVELQGVDIFDPLKGEVNSTGAEKVAAWFLDSDYDGRCFCSMQAFFPDQSAWEKIAKALGSQADEEAFAAFAGTVSLPFKKGKHGKIAVKVIDPRGNEVMAFKKLED